jgi:hypothetical protein
MFGGEPDSCSSLRLAALERYLSVHSDDEGNAYARLGDILSHLGRKDEARAAHERGVRQAEKYGHSGMAEELRLAIIQLGEQDYGTAPIGKLPSNGCPLSECLKSLLLSRVSLTASSRIAAAGRSGAVCWTPLRSVRFRPRSPGEEYGFPRWLKPSRSR